MTGAVLASSDPTPAMIVAGVLAAVVSAVVFAGVAVMAVRWRRLRGAKTRTEVYERAFGSRIARMIGPASLVLGAVFLVMAIVVKATGGT